jgi:hypothetical protein
VRYIPSINACIDQHREPMLPFLDTGHLCSVNGGGRAERRGVGLPHDIACTPTDLNDGVDAVLMRVSDYISAKKTTMGSNLSING